MLSRSASKTECNWQTALSLDATSLSEKQVGFHLTFDIDVKRQIGNPEILSRPQRKTQKARSNKCE